MADLWGPTSEGVPQEDRRWTGWKRVFVFFPRLTERGWKTGRLMRRTHDIWGPGGCRTEGEYLTVPGYVARRLDD